MRQFAFFALMLTSPQVLRAGDDYYLVEALAAQSGNSETRAQARALKTIYADLSQQAGVEARLVYSSDTDINAFATEVGGEKIVVVQEGLLQTMGDDRDAIAAALGHELAHHEAEHIRAGRRKQEGVRVLGAILGTVVGAKIGRKSGEFAAAAAGTAVGIGAGLMALKFNRNQEMEADRLSVGWMIATGYNPRGMLRLQHRLGEMEGHRHAAILSTHPTSAKRYQATEQLIAKLAPPSELLTRLSAPLISNQSLAEARAAIELEEDAHIASVLKPQGDVPATALIPIDGVSFDTYAALGNELLFFGAKGQSEVLAKHRISGAQLARLNENYMARMQQDQALAQRYSADFFRATQGKFAAHGRDLAESYEKGQALQLDPPYPLETARILYIAMRSRDLQSMDADQQAAAEVEVLKPLGFTYYEFFIGHNWWSRKATIAAISGDSSLMQSYLDDAVASADEDHAKAEAAGVHMGDHVKIGNGLHIGGRAPTTSGQVEDAGDDAH